MPVYVRVNNEPELLAHDLEAAVAAGRGAVSHEGRMVDEPIAMRARRFLGRYEALEARRAAAGEALQ